MLNDNQAFEIAKLLTSAFAGAFFAYLFIRFADRGKSRKEKYKTNRRSLSKIQLIGNENCNLLSGTLFNIEQILNVIKLAREKSQNPFTTNRLMPITIDKDILLDLRNDDFINDYFSYTVLVEKHNSDVNSINNFHDSMKMARLTGQISPENYKENMQRLGENIKLFESFCIDSLERTQIIIAKSRVLLKEESSLIRKLFKKTYKGYNKDFDRKSKAELLLLKEEIRKTQEQSKKDIDEVKSSISENS